jgi:integrase
MSVYPRKGSPFYWMSISVPGRPRFRGSTGETNEKAARLVEAKKEQELLAGTPKVEAWRVRDCFGAYWSDHGQHKETEGDILRSLAILRAHFGTDTPIAAITNADVMSFRAKRRGGTIKVDDRKLGPVSPSTVNRDLAYLQAALTHAHLLHGKQPPALAWKQLKLKEPEHRVRYAGADEFAKLLENAHDTIRPAIVAAVTTGLRKANLLALDWHQVDLGGATITIPRTKGRKPLAIRIAPPLAAVLGRTAPDQRKGRVFDKTNFRKRWEAARKATGLVDFKFHDLRHTFASWARMNGADLADICEAMGHSTVAVTMRYAHVKPDSRDTAFDRVGEMLQPRKIGRRSQSKSHGGKK